LCPSAQFVAVSHRHDIEALSVLIRIGGCIGSVAPNREAQGWDPIAALEALLNGPGCANYLKWDPIM